MKKKGRIIEALGGIQFRVQCQDGEIVRVYLSGKMRKFHITVLIGDMVEFEHPQGSEIGRLTRRL